MAVINIENQRFVFDDSGVGYPDGWHGYYINQTEKNDLTFRNNYMSSNNENGYMLEAGDELPTVTNNRLDDSVIEHNYFKWNGTLNSSIITHGIFTGFQLGVKVRYNYCDNVPMAIIRKSNGMVDTSGGVVAYNVVRNPKPGIVVKGMNNVQIYNNTFYSNLSSSVGVRPFVEIYENTDITPTGSATNTKVKNNIFYAVDSGIRFVSLANNCDSGFECDYNIYWCENSTNNEPTFTYHGSRYTWTQWRALGFDTHSRILNPKFVDTTTLIPAFRLDYGINLGLGTLMSHGLDFETEWTTATTVGNPKTCIQDSNWQVGAYVLRTRNDIGGDYYLAPWGSDTSGDGSFNNPWFTLNRLWPSLSAGDTVYMRGGDYDYTSRQYLTGKNGTSGSMIKIHAYEDETPNITELTSFTRGTGAVIHFSGNYVHFKGIHISGYPQILQGEMTFPFRIDTASHNIFEQIVIHDCGLGMHIGNYTDDNLILNCDVYNIYDPYSTSGGASVPYENGDGFSLGYYTAGTTNTFRGCRAWNCCDDGFDLWRSSGHVILDSCWAFNCGFREDNQSIGGNGNGFKLGVTGDAEPWTQYEGQHLRTIQNCIAFDNRVNGFEQNAAYCIHHFYNNTAFWNGGCGFNVNYGLDRHIVMNNIEYSNGNTSLFNHYATLTTNTFLYNGANNPAYSVQSSDFLTSSITISSSPRKYDGSLPVLNFFHLAQGSDLIYSGTHIPALTKDCDGKNWNSTPSLGAFEYVPALTGYYVAPWGNDNLGTGTFTNPYATLKYAWDHRAAAGVTIYMRGGVYEIDSHVNITTPNGSSGNTINIYNFPDEIPTIRPSSEWFTKDVWRGITIRVNYVHMKGLEIEGFRMIKYGGYDSLQGWGGGSSLRLYNANYCTLERLNIHHGMFGIAIENGESAGVGIVSTGNLVLNCDVHHNYDPFTVGYTYGGVDGITSRVDLVGGTVNTFKGCRMWDNSDDGFDGWGNEGLLIFDSCWAFHNGFREDGVTIGGDGGGFKLGPIRTLWQENQSEYNVHLRTIQNCIAYDNREVGFNENATCCVRHVFNNIAYKNRNNGFVFNWNYINNPVDVVRNNISYHNRNNKGATYQAYFNSRSIVDHNTFTYNSGFNPSYNVSDIDFISIDEEGLDGGRREDGSLPLLTFLHLAEGSSLIMGGVNVGLEYDCDGNSWHNTYPSLGPFEFIDYIIPPTVTTTAASAIGTNSATTGGNVTSDGGSTIISRGVCYSTSPLPDLSDSFISTGGTTGAFTINLTLLTPNTVYYVRAYAANIEGTAYGNQITFRTSVVTTVPTVGTTIISDITTSSARSGGNVLSDGNSPVTAKGVCWNTTGTPTIADSHTVDGSGQGYFTSLISGLNDNTYYYVRAYATNSVGTSYGASIGFNTLIIDVPITLTDGLVAYWKLHEYSVPLYDSVNTFHLRGYGGTPMYSAIGIDGYAVDLSNPDTWISLPTLDSIDLLPSGEQFTLSFWVNFSNLHIGEDINQQIIYWENYGIPGYLVSCYVRGNSGSLNFYFKTNDGGYCETQCALSISDENKWLHIVCIANGIGNRGNMYVNGVKYTSYTDQMDIPLLANGPLYIGKWNTVVQVMQPNAVIDEIGFWHRALSEEEVLKLIGEDGYLSYPFDGTKDNIVYLRTPRLLKFGII